MPKVSVCIVTYNQEKYIRDCLIGVLNQKINFNFEIIVCDDCSSDKTSVILKEFKEKYPNIIKLTIHEKNIGAYKNTEFAHQQAIGEYICHLDGDDFMLPGKLQAQVDYLDNHPECNIVWHGMKMINGVSGEVRENIFSEKIYPVGGFKRKDLLMLGSLACHSSKMYRTERNNYLKPNYWYIDFYADIQHIGDGRGAYLFEVLGGYRTSIGISSMGEETLKILVQNLNALLDQFPQYKSYLGVFALRIWIRDTLRKRSTLSESRKLVRKTLKLKTIFNFVRLLFLLKIMTKIPHKFTKIHI